MSNATLMAHTGKAHLVTMEQLKALPTPEPLGTHHEPIPHCILAMALEIEAMERGYSVTRSQYALGMNGSALFGVMDLMPTGVVVAEERGLSLGFRNSTNSALAIKVVAGNRVFVCDNLALSGDMIAVLRRNTTGLDLEAAIKIGFEKFQQHASSLDRQIMILQAKMISDIEAKARVFDIFANRILPVHLFDDVEKFYFHPTDDMTDCQPRSEWGLHNAFTRAIKKMRPITGFEATVGLGRAFGLSGKGTE